MAASAGKATSVRSAPKWVEALVQNLGGSHQGTQQTRWMISMMEDPAG